ncbi:transposase, partial [Mycobacterium rufum]|nr:transposase [Mycolicibacterium rufum]
MDHQDPHRRRRPRAPAGCGGHRRPTQRRRNAVASARRDRGTPLPRTGSFAPDAVIADRAYSSGVTRRFLRARRITAVIPQKRDEIANRKRRGSAGGRPPALDEIRYKQRNLVERSYALLKQWRGLATRYDKL